MRNFFRNNGLSIVFFLLFLFALLGQYISGWMVYNNEQFDEGAPKVGLLAYLRTGHFAQATFENWESEFLQMALFVILTISLRQRGSSESKGFSEEEVDREPNPRKKKVPWPVKKGGWVLKLYQNSLSIALLILFLLSFILHFDGSMRDENAELQHRGLEPHTVFEYIRSSRFWFESFQNWQSEFLSVFAIVVMSIYLRQKGSPQSKPVDAPDEETGE
jgi:hypothetical protein